ncbi:unnamed protein product [Adineta ricciae]|uniref:Transmembrane protein n=1 Tax=Adineta ricciae TaxID=249248 RepID=A0A813U740_ADIRI|nr:unnamed protein product [Adineta ricciae]CAF1579382.1 unnamed protein product [Adineta ricciae]
MFLTVSDQSSTALHVLLRVNIIYTFFWFVLEILLFIFKYYQLTYAANAFGLEMAIIFMLSFNEFIRQFFGMKGNLVLEAPSLILFIVYGLFSSVGFVFFLVLQSYAQRVEILLSAIGLALIVIEIVLSIITIIRNSRAMPVLTKEQQVERMRQATLRLETWKKTD